MLNEEAERSEVRARARMSFLENEMKVAEIERSLSAISVRLPIRMIAYLSLALCAALILSGIVSLFSGAVLPALLLLSLSLLSLRIPKAAAGIAREMRVKEIERGLPFFLRNFSHLLNLGLSPVKALERSASFSGGKVLERALSEARKGKPLERTLSDAAERVGSEKFSDAVSAILSVLSDGYSPGARELLEGIASRLSDEREDALETYSAKSQLIFMAVAFTTAVFPALVGFGLALRAHSPLVPILVYGLFFPLLAVAEFSYLRYSAP